MARLLRGSKTHASNLVNAHSLKTRVLASTSGMHTRSCLVIVSGTHTCMCLLHVSGTPGTHRSGRHICMYVYGSFALHGTLGGRQTFWVTGPRLSLQSAEVFLTCRGIPDCRNARQVLQELKQSSREPSFYCLHVPEFASNSLYLQALYVPKYQATNR
jgi:hypothetical protein